MKATFPMQKMRFASCFRVTRLLQILPEMTGRNFVPLPVNKMNLTRREIFRGKVSLRKNQTNQTDLEDMTQPAPNPLTTRIHSSPKALYSNNIIAAHA